MTDELGAAGDFYPQENLKLFVQTPLTGEIPEQTPGTDSQLIL